MIMSRKEFCHLYLDFWTNVWFSGFLADYISHSKSITLSNLEMSVYDCNALELWRSKLLRSFCPFFSQVTSGFSFSWLIFIQRQKDFKYTNKSLKKKVSLLYIWKYIWLVKHSDLFHKSEEKKKIKLIITVIINFLSSDLLLNTYFYILQYLSF